VADRLPVLLPRRRRLAGHLLLAAAIAIEPSIVAITVLINKWNARFYNALQDRD